MFACENQALLIRWELENDETPDHEQAEEFARVEELLTEIERMGAQIQEQRPEALTVKQELQALSDLLEGVRELVQTPDEAFDDALAAGAE